MAGEGSRLESLDIEPHYRLRVHRHLGAFGLFSPVDAEFGGRRRARHCSLRRSPYPPRSYFSGGAYPLLFCSSSSRSTSACSISFTAYFQRFFPLADWRPFGRTPDDVSSYFLWSIGLTARAYWPFIAMSALSRLGDFGKAHKAPADRICPCRTRTSCGCT